MTLFILILAVILIVIALTVAIPIWTTYKSVKGLYSDVSFSWGLMVRRKSRGSIAWYCEYHNGIRIYDYFSLMITNHPILTFRVFDNPHEDSWTTYTLGFLVFFNLSFQIRWGGEWLGEEWNPDTYENAWRDLDDQRKVLEQKRKDLDDEIEEFNNRRKSQ